MTGLSGRLGKIIPVVVFVIFCGFVWRGLSNDPRLIPSVLIGKSIPEFNLAALPDLNVPGLSSADIKTVK